MILFASYFFFIYIYIFLLQIAVVTSTRDLNLERNLSFSLYFFKNLHFYKAPRFFSCRFQAISPSDYYVLTTLWIFYEGSSAPTSITTKLCENIFSKPFKNTTFFLENAEWSVRQKKFFWLPDLKSYFLDKKIKNTKIFLQKLNEVFAKQKNVIFCPLVV